LTRQSLPAHVGFIPDGNRRWAVEHGLARQEGYGFGIEAGLRLFEICKSRGIPEASVFGFTQDNTKRPVPQIEAFRAACVTFALEIYRRGAALLVVGDDRSPLFPAELRSFRSRRGTGMRVNLLVNYGWEWDLAGLKEGQIRSQEVPRLDLIVRWGGGRRLTNRRHDPSEGEVVFLRFHRHQNVGRSSSVASPATAPAAEVVAR
jgi:undecaprenyl diphosphate synthase